MRTLGGLTAIRTGTTVAALATVILAGVFTVFRAEATLPPIIDLNTTSADVTIYGEEAGDWFGFYGTIGDINGDDVDDVILGAHDGNGAGNGGSAGEVRVIYGSANLPASIDLSTDMADLSIYGDDAGDRGGDIATGDVNGDTVDDLIYGAHNADQGGGTRANAGEAYVTFGGPSLPTVIDLDSTSADVTILGDAADANLGIQAASGDINGDTVDDVIVSAFRENPPGGNLAGETYVFYGGGTFPSTIDLNSSSADVTIQGDDADDFSGISIGAADVNDDGVDDLLIGAHAADPGGRSEAGEVYVIYGGPSLPSVIDLNSVSADVTILGDDPGDQLADVAGGDFNGDTVSDIIVSARYADGPGSGTGCGMGQVGDRCQAGETYVILGGPSLPAVIDLDAGSANVTIYGRDAEDWATAKAATDMNSDGPADLIIGARLSDGSGSGTSCGSGQGGDRCEAGETYVVRGSSSPPTIIDLATASLLVTVYGDDADDESGRIAAAGDINGDGIPDLLIAALYGDGPGAGPACPTGGSGDRCKAGEAYVIYGELPPPVGGIAELPEVAGTPLETGGSSGGNAGVLAGVVGVVAAGAVAASAVGLGGAAWYTRRRRG